MTKTYNMTVAWFDPKKGYGLLVADNLEATFKSHQLHKAGFTNVGLVKGLSMVVELGKRDNGKFRVEVIHSVDGKPVKSVQTTKRTQFGEKPMRTKMFRELPVGTVMEAKVHSYEVDKGYGFFTVLGDENHDVGRVFFHVTSVPRVYKDLLVPEAVFQIKIVMGKRGQMASVIEPFDMEAYLEELAAMPMQLPDGAVSDDEAA